MSFFLNSNYASLAHTGNKENNDLELKPPISPIPSVPEFSQNVDMIVAKESSDPNRHNQQLFFNNNNNNNAKQPVTNVQIFKASDNNVLPPPPPYQHQFIGKMGVSNSSSSSSNNLHSLNESKENRQEENQAPIFVWNESERERYWVRTWGQFSGHGLILQKNFLCQIEVLDFVRGKNEMIEIFIFLRRGMVWLFVKKLSKAK